MTRNARYRGKSRWYYALLFPLFLTASCSDETLNLFFDIPPPTAAERAAAAAKQKEEARAAEARAAQADSAAVAREAGPAPEIEATSEWDKVLETLPQDDMGEPDWTEAMRQGLIKPRAQPARLGNPEARVFKWDFYFSGPDPESDAYFPHSVHTEWLTCESCHPAIFPYRELGADPTGRHGIVMDQVFEGEYCGKCHGVVAFSLDNCSACHTKM